MDTVRLIARQYLHVDDENIRETIRRELSDIRNKDKDDVAESLKCQIRLLEQNIVVLNQQLQEGKERRLKLEQRYELDMLSRQTLEDTLNVFNKKIRQADMELKEHQINYDTMHMTYEINKGKLTESADRTRGELEEAHKDAREWKQKCTDNIYRCMNMTEDLIRYKNKTKELSLTQSKFADKLESIKKHVSTENVHILEEMTEHTMNVQLTIFDLGNQLTRAEDDGNRDSVARLMAMFGTNWQYLARRLHMSNTETERLWQLNSLNETYENILHYWRENQPDDYYSIVELFEAVELMGESPLKAMPIDANLSAILKDNGQYLHNNIIMDVLWSHLDEFIKSEARQYIKRGRLYDEQITRLLRVVRSMGSYKESNKLAFKRFITCLEESGNKDACSRLEDACRLKITDKTPLLLGRTRSYSGRAESGSTSLLSVGTRETRSLSCSTVPDGPLTRRGDVNRGNLNASPICSGICRGLGEGCSHAPCSLPEINQRRHRNVTRMGSKRYFNVAQ